MLIGNFTYFYNVIQLSKYALNQIWLFKIMICDRLFPFPTPFCRLFRRIAKDICPSGEIRLLSSFKNVFESERDADGECRE